jgi:hypothetical protein
MVIIVLVHWQIRREADSINAFLRYWNGQARIRDRRGLVGEFLSDCLSLIHFPYVTWNLDPESLDDFKSYVTVGLWTDAEEYQAQVGAYFNDDKPLLPFEMHRRRRVVFEPVSWRIGHTELPVRDSPGVK